ncbi:hypothetical protein OK006_6522 [Actinobacteria bacterium OK006]|nr:hypothetical protein OK006_6522 [Actinobacteria bacterium OK006]
MIGLSSVGEPGAGEELFPRRLFFRNTFRIVQGDHGIGRWCIAVLEDSEHGLQLFVREPPSSGPLARSSRSTTAGVPSTGEPLLAQGPARAQWSGLRQTGCALDRGVPVGDLLVEADDLARRAPALLEPSVVEGQDRETGVVESRGEQVRGRLLRHRGSAGHDHAAAVGPRIVPGGSTPSTRGTAQTGSGSAITTRSTVIRLTTKPSSSASRATARGARRHRARRSPPAGRAFADRGGCSARRPARRNARSPPDDSSPEPRAAGLGHGEGLVPHSAPGPTIAAHHLRAMNHGADHRTTYGQCPTRY